jgi:DNA-binding SARP family transcriptional activator
LGRRKATALLAYLTVTGDLHARDFLATLLLPNLDQSTGRARLRRILLVLRDGLGDGLLDADRERIALHLGADLWSEGGRFRRLLADCEGHDHSASVACADCGPLLEEAAALHAQGFLIGFTLRDSVDFDEWQCFEAEGLLDELSGALDRLAHWYGSQGAPEQAIPHARRGVRARPAQRAGTASAYDGLRTDWTVQRRAASIC